MITRRVEHCVTLMALVIYCAAATGAAEPSGSGGNGSTTNVSRQAGTAGFLKYNDPCTYIDAWTRFSLTEMLANPGQHCDPTLLLVCVTKPNGLKLCDCGLVNSRFDTKLQRCLALAGAPCGSDGLFGYDKDKLKVSSIDCKDSNTQCIKQSFPTFGNEQIQTYSTCSCPQGTGVDEQGSCTGWSGVGRNLGDVITISLLMFLLFFSPCE